MKDVILIVGMALTFLFGWFLMEQLDRFLYENQKRIRLDTMEFATFWCYNTIKRGGETPEMPSLHAAAPNYDSGVPVLVPIQ